MRFWTGFHTETSSGVASICWWSRLGWFLSTETINRIYRKPNRKLSKRIQGSTDRLLQAYWLSNNPSDSRARKDVRATCSVTCPITGPVRPNFRGNQREERCFTRLFSEIYNACARILCMLFYMWILMFLLYGGRRWNSRDIKDGSSRIEY